MKRIIFLLRTSIIIGLTSCMLSCDKDNFGPTITDPEYISFSIKVTDNLTKNPTESGDYEGTVKEKKISSMRFVFFDNSKVIDYFDLDIATDGIDPFTGNNVYLSSGNNVVITTPIQLPPADYKLVAIANPNSTIKGVTVKNSTINEFEAAAKQTVNNLTGANSDQFLMLNNNGYINIPSTSFKNTEDKAQAAPVAIKLERAVAKVFVYGNPKMLHNQYDMLRDIKWKLDVTNKWTYWMRKQTYKLGGSVLEDETTPMSERYAEDPNYNNISTLPLDEQKEQFNYIVNGPSEIFTKALPSELNENNESSYEYVLENTMRPDDYDDYTVTSIAIQGVYQPDEIGNTGSFYYYNNTVITLSDMDMYAIWVKDPSKGTPIPARLSGLADAVKAVNDSIADYPYGMPHLSFSIKGLNCYLDGVCYYRLKIRHFMNSSVSANDYGYYGLVRNNIYRIRLVSVSGPGSPGFEEIDPSDELEISFNAYVNPWWERFQEEDLYK